MKKEEKINALVEKVRENNKLISCRAGILYRWNGRYWEKLPESWILAEAAVLWGKEYKNSWFKNAMERLILLCAIPPGRDLNDRIDYICVKNGMLNIKTLALEDYDPDFLATYELPVSYEPDSNARCDRFLQFLEETIGSPEAIAQVQEFFGYCFLRHIRFIKILMLVGPGCSGKTTLLNVLREIIGDENCSSVALSDLSNKNYKALLYQKSINITDSEVIEKNMEALKGLVCGDPVEANFKNQARSFSFTPSCKFLLLAQNLPRIEDWGLQARLMPIIFPLSFLYDEVDLDILEKLLAEKEAIFLWALAGLQRLLKNKRFTLPAEPAGSVEVL